MTTKETEAPVVQNPQGQRVTEQQQVIVESLPPEMVAIRCDDRVFVCHRASFSQGSPDSLLARMFGSEHDTDILPMLRDNTHPHRPFIFDRNPVYFSALLDFFRYGEILFSEQDTRSLRGLFLEAQYFCVEELIELLSFVKNDTIANSKLHPPKALTAGEEALRNRKVYTRADVEKVLMHTPAAQPKNFQECQLAKCVFVGADLRAGNFTRCQLPDATFRDADLTGANLTRCDGPFAQFVKSKLCNASLISAHLPSANFSGANLSGSTLTGTILKNATFAQADLSNVEREGTSLSMGGVLM